MSSVDISAFEADDMGELVGITGVDARTGRPFDHFAFLPTPLPDRISLTDETHVRVAEASAALGRLDMASMQVPNPMLLRRPTIRREAQSTSALEGTYAPFEDVLRGQPDGASVDTLHEVLNYVTTAEIALDLIEDRPLSIGMLKSLQGMLVEGTDSEATDSGGLRDRQVVIGAPSGDVADSRFVPVPPGDRLVYGMELWEGWLQASHPALAPAVQAAMAHYQFETLHPFSDGNGRIGRLVIVLQLQKLGALSGGLLSVSPWFEKRRREYQDQLLRLSQTGDWSAWVTFFATGVRDQAESTCSQVRDLLALQESYKQTGVDNKWSGFVLQLADELIGYPIVAPTSVADRHDVSYPTAKRAIDKLVEAGILEEATGRSYGRSYIAGDVYRILSR